MAAIRVHEFMSLDGVIDAPAWTFEYGYDPRMGEAIAALTAGCQGILLGRTTYEMFEPAWSQRTVEDDPGAPFFNDTTKYVVSSTLRSTTWRNAELLAPQSIRPGRDPTPEERPRRRPLRQRQRHARTALLADGLADELHLFVYPLTRGSGPRLFPDNAAPHTFALSMSASYDNGVVHLACRPQA